jgi:hypothetical protein
VKEQNLFRLLKLQVNSNSDYLLQILKIYMVLLKLEMMQTNYKWYCAYNSKTHTNISFTKKKRFSILQKKLYFSISDAAAAKSATDTFCISDYLIVSWNFKVLGNSIIWLLLSLSLSPKLITFSFFHKLWLSLVIEERKLKHNIW